MRKYINLFDITQKVDYKTEILSGLTVALALIPEAVSFALIAGLHPLNGLYAAFILGLISSIFGGRPAMISGATAAVAVVIAPLVKSHGVDYVFATVILAGIFQLIAGFARLGKFMRLVPIPAILGFMNGIGILIFLAQVNQFKDASGNWLSGSPFFIYLGLVVLTILIIWFLPKLTKAVPSSLVAILTVFAIVFFAGIETKTVGAIAGGFPKIHIPTVPFSFETLQVIFPYAVIFAGVGLIQSLLSLTILDEITQTKGRSNKEAIAQGTGNILAGFISAMGGAGMLGQSLININSGARARLSGIIGACMLLVFVMFGSNFISIIPMAALTGVMIMVAFGTFKWATLRMVNKMPKQDVFIVLTVTLITVLMKNLALAVFVGVIISALVFAWESAKRIRARKFIDDKGVKHYEIYGPLFFGSTSSFQDKFDIANDPNEVIIDFAESRVADMSAIEALNKLTERYQKVGKKIHLKHLSSDCKVLLKNAEEIIEVNVLEDPTYKVAIE
ncbi:MAG: SulP family inorganic anion transporter [Bacteroidia bacterium]|nr:SulP family inorganic anion transporter [Bacteroidia bacterium]MCF8428058.1 SulP family inorganic anion transporter [Bacteroidia bacterium]MCF8446683.1 SulP family inorganic anion transporter [Bacteroidia bacterium]